MMGKTVLIGLDGATFTILDPLMASGVMPFLRDFVAGGVRGTLRSVIPALTPPAWTSLMTGKRPGEHGVFDFFQKESPESLYYRFATSRDIQTDTIWSLASDYGCRVTALNFPLMFPPPRINGCVVPGGWMPWRQLRLGCHPAGLFDRLKSLPSFDPRELSHDAALEEKALEGCAQDEYADWIKLHTRRERRWTDVLLYLMREEPADLTAILFDGVDKLQHLCWRFLDPACKPASATPWEAEIQSLCESYFRQLDGLIAEIADQAGSEATVVMASDHGFGPSTDILFLNSWLEEHGYLAWAPQKEAPVDGSHRVGIGQIARHINDLDWSRTVAYAGTPSSQGIHIVRQTPDRDGGVSTDSIDRLRREIQADLQRYRHPLTGKPVVTDVWTREEAFAGPFEAFAPDLTIRLANDGVVSIVRSESSMKCRLEPVGTHQPEGIIVGRGPELHSGKTLGESSIVDVAPLLLHCLGVPVPADMTGRLPLAAFKETVSRQASPVACSGSPSVRPRSEESDAPDVEYDPDEMAVVMKRLSALGYLE